MDRDLYLALGDSVTAGYDATHPSLSFVRHVSDFVYQKRLARQTVVVAKNGWTSKDLWNAIQGLPPGIWNRTKVLTLMTGGNDLRKLLRRQFLPLGRSAITPELIAQRLEEFEFYYQRICGFLAQHAIPHHVVMTVYNPVPNFPLGVHAMESLNEIIKDIAKQNNFAIADVYQRFRNHEPYYIADYRRGLLEDLISPIRRPIHPNNIGHKQIADLISTQLTAKSTKPNARRPATRQPVKRQPATRGSAAHRPTVHRRDRAAHAKRA